jgi:hypothetical protein
MAAPVWVLSVDLQTKTATFQSGMADAAKAARGSFNDIKSGASEMGRATSTNMGEARHGVMLLGEEFGIHLPRALTTFIASLGPVGAAMEAAFPFLALITLATLFIEHLSKMKEKGEQLTEAQAHFGIVAANVLNELDDRLLQAGIHADELAGNHLAALEKQLTLIDHQTLTDLRHAFDELAKGADGTFAHLKKSWYEFGVGSDGAKASLERFQRQYDDLLAHRKGDEANKLLDDTIQREQRILDLAKQAQPLKLSGNSNTDTDAYNKLIAARVELQKMGADWSKIDLQSQESLVGSLQTQVDYVKERNELNTQEKKNDRTADAQRAQQEAEATERAWESAIDKRASAEQRFYAEQKKRREESTKSAVQEAAKEAELQMKAAEAVNKLGLEEARANDQRTLASYLEFLNNKKEKLDESHKLGIVTEREHAEQMIDVYREQYEAQKAYLDIQISRTQDPDKKLQLQRQLTEETLKYGSALGKVNESLRRYESTWTDYFAKMDAATKNVGRNVRVELEGSVDKAVNGFSSGFAKTIVEGKNLVASLRGTAADIAESFIESATKQLLMHEMVVIAHTAGNVQMAASDKATAAESQLAAAKAGAAKAYQAMAGIPIVGPALGAVAAAGAFALMLGFEKGGIVPGVGQGDIVPAMLTPGEAVLTKDMTEKLSRASGRDSESPAPTRPIHVHVHHSPTIHALDAESMERVLNKNAHVVAKHVTNQVRKLNR